MSSPDADLRGRIEQLEADRDNLYVTFRAVDGELHEAVARHRADRTFDERPPARPRSSRARSLEVSWSK
jgi:hypothetical protein